MLPIILAMIQLWATPQTPLFMEEAPTILIESNAVKPDLIRWQISEEPDFLDPREEVTPYRASIQLPLPLFSNEIDYFTRSQVFSENGWSKWSEPCVFQVQKHDAYTKSSNVSQKIWDQVTPYLLPENHPIKTQLDQLFSKQRAILSVETMEKAGFENPTPRKWTHLIVTKHPEFPGYIFKLYLDAQRYHKNKPEYRHWIERASGALAIRELVQSKGWEDQFKAPVKWIYPLPDHPSPPKEFIRKNFILVEEDMDILNHQDNYSKWKDETSKETLDKLFTICEQLGVHDSKPDNMPYSHDGKIAFVDTQPMYFWPVLYSKFTPFLSKSNQAYWKILTKNKRKK